MQSRKLSSGLDDILMYICPRPETQESNLQHRGMNDPNTFDMKCHEKSLGSHYHTHTYRAQSTGHNDDCRFGRPAGNDSHARSTLHYILVQKSNK